MQLISINLDPLAILSWGPPVTDGMFVDASSPSKQQKITSVHGLDDSIHRLNQHHFIEVLQSSHVAWQEQ